MLLRIEMSADTMGGVMLGNVVEVFTHAFTQYSFSVSNILSKTYLTGDTVDNVVGFATTAPNGIVIASSNGLLILPEVSSLMQYLQLFLVQKLRL